MPDRQVRELAEELARHLERDSAIDPSERRALEELRADIDRAIESRERAEHPPSTQARNAIERLEKKHPELTAFVQRLADALSAIGL